MNSIKNRPPIEYQRKWCKFLGRKFYVDERVHIPRKNTEPLVEFALQYIKQLKRNVACADVGTGAGVIAISLVLESPHVVKVFAIDLFAEALEVAKKNVKKYKLKGKVILKKGNLLTPIKNEKVEIIVANLPHASKETFESKSRLAIEPKLGVLAGRSGLEIIEAFLKQLVRYKKFSQSIAIMFLKISPDRAHETIKLVRKHLSSAIVETKLDIERKPRYLIVKF